MKIFLPICDNGGGAVKGNYVMCLMEAFKGIDVQIARVTDSHADRQCNKMANEFLHTDCDRMLIIDTDIIFTRRDIENILSHDVPLVYGIYPKKDERGDPCLGTFEDVPVNGDLATVRRCGRGFMLVKRELIEAMKEDNGGPALRYHNHGRVEWAFFPSGPVRGDLSVYGWANDEQGFPKREWISEDWHFCENARRLGVPTLVDVRIALEHEGSKIYRLNPMDLKVDLKWQNIRGWFTEEDAECYRRIAEELPDGSKVAEIGVYQGRSLAALWTFLREQSKKAEIFAIDTFEGTPGDREEAVGHGPEITLKDRFLANMRNIGMNGELTTLTGQSTEMAERFEYHSLDAVFIDGGHDYAAVAKDLVAWTPAVKSGGIIAGHDYDYPGVQRAVDERFPNAERIGRCWFVKL